MTPSSLMNMLSRSGHVAHDPSLEQPEDREAFDAETARVQALTDAEFKALSVEVRRTCSECGWLKAYVSWWCTNNTAIKARKTRIPGVCRCLYWKPQ